LGCDQLVKTLQYDTPATIGNVIGGRARFLFAPKENSRGRFHPREPQSLSLSSADQA
jgi:hypothetical protein